MKILNNTYNQSTIASNIAFRSPCLYRLGAVITKGRNKVVCRGYNTNKRSAFLGKISCCQHAEMAVATKFINTHVRRNLKKFRRSQIKVARVSFFE